MKKCPYCSAELQDEAQFCYFCMQKLAPKSAVGEKIKIKKRMPIILSLICLILCVILALTAVFLNRGKAVADADNPSGSALSEGQTNNESKTDSLPQDNNQPDSPTQDNNQPDSTDQESGSDVSTDTQGGTKPEIGEDDPPADKNEDDTSDTDNSGNTQTPGGTQEPDTTPEPVVQPDWEVKEVSGGVEITSIGKTASDGVYNIPQEIDGKTVVGIGEAAFYNEQGLKAITLPSSLKYISAKAFYGCKSLGEIQIPSGVTSIGNNAFTNCRKLSKIYIASNNISIDTYAFSTQYQRDVNLTIYAPSSVMDSIQASLHWDAEYVEYNG